jgi:uncharacterized membrane protein YccC
MAILWTGVLRQLSASGFDRPRLAFALRTALVACFAMACAWAFGLDHPQWAAMTVWAAAQPTRGRLVEKALFRLVGTLSGAGAGIALVWVSALNPWILIPGLAIWIALCAAIGNLQRGFVAYGTILAGYSAAMVILLDYGHPEQILALADDRVFTILTGVASAVLWGALFTPHAAEGQAEGRLRCLIGDLLQDVSGCLATGQGGKRGAAQTLSEIAAIEDMLDPHSGGFFRSRMHVRHSRRLLNEAVALQVWLEDAAVADSRCYPEAAEALAQAAQCLCAGALSTESASEVKALLRRVVALRPNSALGEALSGVHQALDGVVRQSQRRAALWGGEGQHGGHRPIILHRDWYGALRAGGRAFVVLLAVGALWQLTGWHAGAFLMLGTSIMISLFSTFDTPSLMMRFVLLGSLFGALLALVWRLAVWPLAGDLAMTMVLVMPVIFIGALVMAHRKTMPMAMDFCMVSLLCLQPTFPQPVVSLALIELMGAVVLAPLVALLAYGMVLPTTLRHRRLALLQAMVNELRALAGASQVRPMVWRARLYHRLIKLHRWSENTPGVGAETSRRWAAEALAITALGQVVLQLREHLAHDALPEASRRRMQLVLRRVQRLSHPVVDGGGFPLLCRALGAAARDSQQRDQELAIILRRTADRLEH